MTPHDSPPQCPRCGRPLAADAAEGLCPSCLLAIGAESTRAVTAGGEPTGTAGSGDPVRERPQFSPGQRLGPYRIIRLLGRGGMGEVYEAEHLEWGRRLALKVLRQRFNNATDRARFLREGQLAASISHPHVVYIFGSEEIDGRPVISMELVPGGTLKDRVATHGPLTPQEATAAALDIVSGLDAAQAAGVLHRDVKPSNCFVDADGTVKIGDFGLSISTLARDVGQRLAWFEGTPSFSAPEQLRGQALDVRADVYAVGATLYYLLTGKAPFDAENLDTLVRKVTREDPPSPRALRHDIPDELARVILRCLSRDPAARPPSHAALADALRPFATEQPPAAPLGARFLAWVIDSGLLGLASTASTAFELSRMDAGIPESQLTIRASAWTLVTFAYYALTLGRSGASPGMQLLGLSVRKTTGRRASWREVIVRTAVFVLPQVIAVLAFYPRLIEVATAVSLGLSATLFITIRRRNGWAALHDLASSTRVVRLSADAVRRPVAPPEPLVSTGFGATRIGPFEVANELGATDEGRLMLGFDPLLRRRVWIHEYDAQAAALRPERRNVSRRTRLYWLSGRQMDGHAWDAYEAPDGSAFETATLGEVSWSEARAWLVDLARELVAASREGTLPRLGLDRLWLRADRRLVLLDFPVRRSSGDVSPSAGADLTPGGLLSAVARHLLVNDERLRPVQLPVTMRAQLRLWADAAPALADVEAALQRVRPLRGSVRGRRAILVALPTIPVALLVLASAFVLLPSLDRFMQVLSVHSEMLHWLQLLDDPPEGSRLRDPEIARQAERYVSARFSSQLTDQALWELPGFRAEPSAIGGREGYARLRPKAEALARLVPEVSREEMQSLEAALTTERDIVAREAASVADVQKPITLMVSAVFAWSLFVIVGGVLTLIMALIVPGGVLTRAAGLAVVTADGREIGRGRSLLRALIVTVPAPVGVLLLVYGIRRAPHLEDWLAAHPEIALITPLPVMAALALWTIVRSQQGPHDWLARVWVVLR